MREIDALFDALRGSAAAEAVDALQALARDGRDDELTRINALDLAARVGLDEDALIEALLHATRLGLFEASWDVVCPGCRGVLDASATLRGVRQDHYRCAFCELVEEPILDDTVEVSFTVSPRLRRVEAHDPEALGFWAYFRQVFFSSAVRFPDPGEFERLARSCLLDTVELADGDRTILSLEIPPEPVIVFDPVTHRAHFIAVEGEPAVERQDLAIVFDASRSQAGYTTLRPGPLRLSLDNRAGRRVFPGLFLTGPQMDALFGRRPHLTAKRLLTNQTFRDIYRTDTLDVDQGLKILSLTFLFTDLQGSTALYERVGDLAAYDLVRAHFRILHRIVGAEGGAVVKTIGDAVMATFPSPEHAVSAALAMRDAMGELNGARGSGDVMLKIGLHEGPCLAVSLNDRQDFFGQTVNIASRVQALATSAAILATEPVVRAAEAAGLLAARGVPTRSRLESLRGITARMPIYELG